MKLYIWNLEDVEELETYDGVTAAAIADTVEEAIDKLVDPAKRISLNGGLLASMEIAQGDRLRQLLRSIEPETREINDFALIAWGEG